MTIKIIKQGVKIKKFDLIKVHENYNETGKKRSLKHLNFVL